MTGPVLPPPPPRPDPGAASSWATAAGTGGIPLQHSRTPRQRRGDIVAISILTGMTVLGLAIILFLAFSGLIRTPWHTFPPGTSQAYFGYGIEALVSEIFGIPIAILTIIVGHVDLVLIRRMRSSRPDDKKPAQMAMTMLLSAILATLYLALAMQVYYFVIALNT